MNITVTNANPIDLKKVLKSIKTELRNTERNYQKSLSEIEDTFQILKTETDYYEKMRLDIINDINEIQGKPPEPEYTPKAKKEVDMKRLYRKISLMCHPDKTDDTGLHELFLEAQGAYEVDDSKELEYIYNIIMSDAEYETDKDSIDQLKKAIKSAEEKLEEKKKEYNILERSISKEIHNKFKSKDTMKQIRARHLYAEMMFRKIEELAKHKDILMKDYK